MGLFDKARAMAGDPATREKVMGAGKKAMASRKAKRHHGHHGHHDHHDEEVVEEHYEEPAEEEGFEEEDE